MDTWPSWRRHARALDAELPAHWAKPARSCTAPAEASPPAVAVQAPETINETAAMIEAAAVKQSPFAWITRGGRS